MKHLTSIAPAGAPLDFRAWVLAIVFAALSFFVNTQGNHFPSTYHPDEPSKARQVLNNEFNFHHPMLLLATTRAIMAVANVPADADAVTIAGRQASALFTAVAVACLVLLAAANAGLLCAGIAGALLVSNHQLLELAHYFKEDPSVLMGISAFFLALTLYDHAPRSTRAALLGVTLGLAISGKYLGAVVAPLGIAMILARSDRKLRDMTLFLAGALVVFLLVNLPIFADLAGFTEGFERELDFAVTGHKGITRSIPHGVYGAVFRKSTNWVIWILLVFYAVGFLLRTKRARLSEWMLALFPLAFAILLSFSPKTHHRYFLPATALLLTLAAIGAITPSLLRWKARPVFGKLPPALPAALLLVAALGVQAPTFFAYFNGFRRDGRTAMAEWLTAHVPPGTVIVQDKRVDLDALHLPYDFRNGKQFAAEVGTVDELRAQGIEYVGVAEGDYGRYFLKNHEPTDAGKEEYYRHRAFYEQLFAEGELVFECPPGTLQYLQPHLKLYRLPPKP